jgi:DMSO/TMAO reductase YedYZ molybdopterin-dependent catalytic subunit
VSQEVRAMSDVTVIGGDGMHREHRTVPGRSIRGGATTRPVNTLPPGQKQLEGFPRFGRSMTRAAPVPADPPVIEFCGVGIEPFEVLATDLLSTNRREVVTDFHCVAGWSATNLRWEGTPFHAVYRERVAPRLPPDAVVTHIAFRGLDGWRSVLTLEDALSETVILADRLNGGELGTDHGAPVRLVSPDQYGYVSTKHLGRIELHAAEPRRGRLSLLGALFMPHPRARVWCEERHRYLPTWFVRPFFRSLKRPMLFLIARANSRREAHPDPLDVCVSE